jgi:hypothetical protein
MSANLRRGAAAALFVALIALSSSAAHAGGTPAPAIEQALAAAMEAKRGITVYIGGQSIGGAVVKIEPGAWVELRNQQYGRIVVRLDRIDAVALP